MQEKKRGKCSREGSRGNVGGRSPPRGGAPQGAAEEKEEGGDGEDRGRGEGEGRGGTPEETPDNEPSDGEEEEGGSADQARGTGPQPHAPGGAEGGRAAAAAAGQKTGTGTEDSAASARAGKGTRRHRDTSDSKVRPGGQGPPAGQERSSGPRTPKRSQGGCSGEAATRPRGAEAQGSGRTMRDPAGGKENGGKGTEKPPQAAPNRNGGEGKDRRQGGESGSEKECVGGGEAVMKSGSKNVARAKKTLVGLAGGPRAAGLGEAQRK